VSNRKRGHGEGSIYQRADGRWCATISLAGTKSRRRKSFYGATRQKVANKLTKALNDRQQGLTLAGNRQTVEQFMTSWLEDSVRTAVRPRTFESYELLSRVHIVPALGRVTLQQLEPQHVQALMAAKLKSGLSPQTVRHIRTVLRRALNFAMKWGIVARNVAALVDPPRLDRHEVKPMTPEQARTFLAAAQNQRFGALYVLALSLGMRQGEVLGLRWSDLDLEGENPTLAVNQALQRIGGEFRFVRPKTDRSRRTIALPKSVVKALLAQRAQQAADRLAIGPAWQDRGLVFTTADGAPIERKFLHNDFKRVLTDATLPDCRFHDLRHSAASMLLAQGIPLREIMELLGHSSITLTADTYSHLMAPAMRAVADTMDLVLVGPVGVKSA
jgi:integrase